MIKELVTKERPVAIYHHVMREFESNYIAVNCGQILMGEKGSYTLYINYIPIELHPGKLIIMRPGDVVRIEGSRDDFVVSCFAYSEDIMHEAEKGFESVVNSYKDSVFNSDDARLYSFAHRLLDVVEPLLQEVSMPCLHEVAVMQLRTFFLVYNDRLSKEGKEGNKLNPRKEELFGKFFHLLVAHHRLHRSVGFYAYAMNMTSRYLNDIVKHVTGSSVKAVIDDYVIFQLKLYLQTSNKSIKEIASDFGFDSLPFFSDYFKSRTRTTPQMFREQ